MSETKFKSVKITTDFITLGQLLKFQNVISNGGEEKMYIAENNILVNGEDNKQRGKKLYPGAKVEINNILFFEITKW